MGRIAAPHGIRGAVKVTPWSQDPGTLASHRTWWLAKPHHESWREVEVTSAHLRGDSLVATIAGVDSRDAAAALRGAEVAVPRDALEAPAPDEYYWADLEGMEVINRSGVRLGRVAGLAESGAHALLRVRADGGEAERLIPFVAAHVDRIDGQARRIDVDWEADY